MIPRLQICSISVNAEAEAGKSFDKQLKAIKERYNEIIKGLGLKLSLDEQFDTIRKQFEALQVRIMQLQEVNT